MLYNLSASGEADAEADQRLRLPIGAYHMLPGIQAFFAADNFTFVTVIFSLSSDRAW